MQKKQLTDEKLDRIVRTLVNDARLDDETLDSIADAPQLWWSVQRNVAGQPAVARRGWVWLLNWRIAVFASVTLIGIFAFSLISNQDGSLSVAGNPTAAVEPIGTIDVGGAPALSLPQDRPAVIAAVRKRPAVRQIPAVSVTARRARVKTVETSEIRSDFIALMYDSESDSGQLVKVKVPRSMMVSLGVATNVQNNSEFVNAEVLMGNDGSARAIRFIQ